MSFSSLLMLLLFTDLPPDVREALDKLTFFENVRMQYVRHTNDPTCVQNARTFYMRNRQGQELIISEPNVDGLTERIAKRMLMRDGLVAFTIGLAPGFQMYASNRGLVPGVSPELLKGSGALAGLENVPTLQSFHLQGRLKAENIQQITVEKKGEREIYHVLTNLKHHKDQDSGSTLSFVYELATARIVETWTRDLERCRIDYGSDGRISSLSLIYDQAPQLNRSWDILQLDTENVPQDFQWRWIGLVPGCQISGSIPEHHTYGSLARWTGEDMVTMDEYRNLVATGQVVSDPEYHRMMAEFMAVEEGKTYQTFERAMEEFEYRYAQSSAEGVLTPWEHLTRKFCSEFSLTEGRRSEAEKICREATERLRKFGDEYNEKRPEVGLLTLMTLSLRAIESSPLSEETKSDRKKSEALKKARDLFLRFWEELRKGQPDSDALKAWDQRFEYGK